MSSWLLIIQLTFQKDLDMLSSKIELMLRKPSYIWMVPKLMAKLFEPNSRYLRERSPHLLQKPLRLLRRGILQKLMVLGLIWRKMDQSGKERHLPDENPSPQ